MNLNQVTLIGRVTRAPECKMTKTNQTMAKFTVVTSFGEFKEYHKIVVFGKYAEVVKEFVYKGRLLHITGRLHWSSWLDQNQLKHYTTEIVVQKLLLLDKHQALVSAATDEEAVATEAKMAESVPAMATV